MHLFLRSLQASSQARSTTSLKSSIAVFLVSAFGREGVASAASSEVTFRKQEDMQTNSQHPHTHKEKQLLMLKSSSSRNSYTSRSSKCKCNSSSNSSSTNSSNSKSNSSSSNGSRRTKLGACRLGVSHLLLAFLLDALKLGSSRSNRISIRSCSSRSSSSSSSNCDQHQQQRQQQQQQEQLPTAAAASA
ncbi:hypothetical protein Efla_004463 [Eimeria flavescens]